MTTLTDLIGNAWQQLKEATRNENWAATRQAFDRMEQLQQVNEESTKNLRKRFPDLAEESNSATRPTAPPAASIGRFNAARRATTRPRELKIDNVRIPISLNNQVVVATANWILKQGKTLPAMKNFIHRTNSGFSASAQIRQLDDGSFIEIGDSQDTLIQKARKLLNACGLDSLKLEVSLEDGTVRTA